MADHGRRVVFELYGSPADPYTTHSIQSLQGSGLDYRRFNVERKPHRERLQRRMKRSQKTGGVLTIPQIFYGNRHIGSSLDLQKWLQYKRQKRLIRAERQQHAAVRRRKRHNNRRS